MKPKDMRLGMEVRLIDNPVCSYIVHRIKGGVLLNINGIIFRCAPAKLMSWPVDRLCPEEVEA